MKKIITQNQEFKRFETDYSSARVILKNMNEEFKTDLIDKFESGDFKNKEKLSDKISFYFNISK
ncbi:MAG: hypothetical protein P1U46_03605 [Patescibacteria group bacterium]|nr:hypothetical protein [Patescibacteria group bacterium]